MKLRNLPKLTKVDLTDTPNVFEGLTTIAHQLYEEEMAHLKIRTKKKK
jgi:hypothetical protein